MQATIVHWLYKGSPEHTFRFEVDEEITATEFIAKVSIFLTEEKSRLEAIGKRGIERLLNAIDICLTHPIQNNTYSPLYNRKFSDSYKVNHYLSCELRLADNKEQRFQIQILLSKPAPI